MDEQAIAKDSGSGGMPNTTIVILAVLAIMITVIGTWAVMNGAMPKTQGSEESNTNVGIVSLTILPPPQSQSDNSAKVTLDVS